MASAIFTIGHATHAADAFLGLLSEHAVDLVADVRSRPYSRFNPQFNKETLRASLERAGVGYVFLGRELGARSDDPTVYVDGKVDYDRLARTALFQEGLGRIAELAESKRIALMCAEKDPLTCHRAILVCRHLAERGVGASHILATGEIETHETALERLLGELGLEERELFRKREDVIAEAYALRASDIAYAAPKGMSAGAEP